MNTCGLCHAEFPNWVEADGKRVNLHSRRYCLSCSPRGLHNTKRLGIKVKARVSAPHKCICGETDPGNFYGTKIRGQCKRCFNKAIHQRMLRRTEMARQYLGGRCMACGFSEWRCSLDIHHLCPERKDPTAERWRGWSWERILKELQHCILLCKNCHAALHKGYDVFEARCHQFTHPTTAASTPRAGPPGPPWPPPWPPSSPPSASARQSSAAGAGSPWGGIPRGRPHSGAIT